MIKTIRNVYIVKGAPNDVEKATTDGAIEVMDALKLFTGKDNFHIETKEKAFYEIEVGDLVRWKTLCNNRIDKVIKITENGWGDTVFITKELNGKQKACAYPSAIELVI